MGGAAVGLGDVRNNRLIVLILLVLIIIVMILLSLFLLLVIMITVIVIICPGARSSSALWGASPRSSRCSAPASTAGEPARGGRPGRRLRQAARAGKIQETAG